MPLRTASIEVSGTEVAKLVAAELAGKSMWFTCEPMPDDVFEFAVKEEALVYLEETIISIHADH
jgi:hypothetical protein